MSAFEELEATVNNIYVFRDTYFDNHQGASEKVKTEAVEAKVDEALEKIEEVTASGVLDTTNGSVKHQLMFLKAKAMNASSKHYPECEKILTKFVKLYPSRYEAWNILGECYWKSNDLYNAQNSFEGSLKAQKNATALRHLSMLMRQVPAESGVTSKNLQDSIDYAREAVSMDVCDGRSWYVLGNAYFASYFGLNQNKLILKQALKSYNKAVQSHDIQRDADFHFNRGLASVYGQDFGTALESFEMASKCNPSWEEPVKRLDALKAFLDAVPDYVSNKGHTKPRKLAQLIKGYDLKDLGPYHSTDSSKDDGKTSGKQLEYVKLSSIKEGVNGGKVILGKVICQVFCSEAVSFTFCIIDDEGTCFAVNLYNVAQGKGVKIGDAVAIPEPDVENISFSYKEKAYQFQWIRVDDPLILVVNGKTVSVDWRATPVMSSVFMPE